MTKRKVRTSIQPGEELEVDQAELSRLHELGLVVTTPRDAGPARLLEASGSGAELAVRAAAPMRAGAVGLGSTHDIQTTMRPDVTITVGDAEYQQLLAEGLVYSGSPQSPAADSYDLLFADKVQHGSATPAALRAAFVPFWAAAETVTAGTVRVDSTGHLITRNANGTTRATYDATEQAAWTVTSSGGGGGGAVTSVAGRTGVVVLSSSDLSDSTATGRSLVATASAAAARTTLGLGTAATQPSSAFETSGAGAAAQAFAVQRANHTGTQPASTVTGLSSVATSGAYGDLSGRPTEPKRISACDFSFWYVTGEAGTSGSDIGRYSRIKTRAAFPCHSIQINFGAAKAQGEASLSAQTSGMTIRASIEVAGIFYKAYALNGSRDITLDADGVGKLYVPGFEIPVGVDIWINSRVIVTDGQKYPVGYGTTGALGEVNSTIATAPTTDFTATAAGRPAAANLQTFHPLSVTGIPYTRQSCVALVGDSITVGKGDPAVANINQGPGGWAVRALSADGSGRYAPKIPFMQMSISGETAGNWATPSKRQARLQQIVEGGCTHAIIALGTNDLTSAAGTFPSLQASLLAIATVLNGHGIICRGVTLIPQTTSTDSWATTANQTVVTSEPQRLSLNAWVRAGMPIDPTTKAAVAIGTGGALTVGQAGHPFVGYYELADTVESARNSGFFKANGTAFAYTVDGIHPSTAGAQAMAAVPNTTTDFALA